MRLYKNIINKINTVGKIIGGIIQTIFVNPSLEGSAKISSPYLLTKKSNISSSDMPSDKRVLIRSRICFETSTCDACIVSLGQTGQIKSFSIAIALCSIGFSTRLIKHPLNRLNNII